MIANNAVPVLYDCDCRKAFIANKITVVIAPCEQVPSDSVYGHS